MFFSTKDLKSFHFGDVQKGQTITPYGWLGVFENANNVQRKIALTGWNGEILWVNDDYADQGTKTEFNVYDMKYDFNTDLIFVARTNSDNGLIDASKRAVRVKLDVLDAKTGIRIGSSEIDQSNSWGYLSGNYIDASNQDHILRSKNLFSLDVISKSATEVLISWQPNFLQLSKRQHSPKPGVVENWDDAINRIVPMYDVVQDYNRLVRNIVVRKNGNSSSFSLVPNIDLRKAASIQDRSGQPGWYVESEWNYLHDYSLITNPFITMSGSDFVVHLLVANKHEQNSNKNKVYHEAVKFRFNGSYVNEVTENVTNKFPILKDKTWIENNNWSKEFINANLRINRNMFDGNSVVFAYPYAAGGVGLRLPIFNVAQISINSNDGRINWSGDKKSSILPFAKEIIDYWKSNNGSYNSNSQLNKIYPFPDNNRTNLNHNYNRLISVSPFDNTILYAAKPNLANSIFDQTNPNGDKWASFWIGDFRRSKPYRPFIVYNDNSLGGTVDPVMTSINDIYSKGLTFDLSSLTGQSFNLYFNQTGSGKNDRYANSDPNFLTSKIGLLFDVLSRDGAGNIWFANSTSPTNKPSNDMGTWINQQSYSTLIYSRANLEKWYPRTWQNIEMASNTLTGNFQLNASASDNTRAIARNFTSALNDGDFFISKKSVDLVSNWIDKNNALPTNYNRLLVKRPEIKVRNESIQNKLPIETIYPFNKTDFLTKNIWIKNLNSNDKNRLVFKTSENLSSASYQIFSSWKDQVRMERIGQDTNNLNAVENHNIGGSAQWYDRRKAGATQSPFGKVNNSLEIKGKKPLRMVLQIEKPANPPQWFGLINQAFFDKYPLQKDAVKGETAFETVLQKYLKEKTEKIDLGQNTSSPVGLGNLKINAFLDVNPSVIENDNFTIYKKGPKKRFIVQNSTGQRIIYEDNYVQQWHEIYDQSQVKYNQFNRGGFGPAVSKNVQTSWRNGAMPSPTTKIKTIINAQDFQDNLVRKSSSDGKIFTFDYKNASTLVVTATDTNWLRTRLLNFQRLINMKPVFEYFDEATKTWKTLTTKTDAEMETIWSNASQNTFELPSSNITNIHKLRLRLKPNDDNDANSFVKINGFSDTDGKFISDEQTIGIQKIDVNKSWFNEVELTNSSSSLNSLTAQDFQRFEDEIFRKSTAIQRNPELRSKVKLMYKWNGESTKYDKEGISDLIRKRLTNFSGDEQGVFALWNGTTGIKIEAFFEKVDSTVSFTVGNNISPSENDLKGYVVSTINNIINLGPYINDLTSNIISATAGNAVGQFSGATIKFPPKSGTSGSEQFAGKTYDEIKGILEKVDVSIQYKQWQPGGTWSNWLNDLNQVNTYDPSNPQIKIGFKINSKNKTWNIKLDNDGEVIDNNKEFTLNLSLPKLVKLPNDASVTKLINDFNSKNIFGGNTYKLTFGNLEEGKKIVSEALKAASSSNPASYAGLDTHLILKFKLGGSEWKEASELKDFLLTQTTDQSSNLLKMKVELRTNSDFILEKNLEDKEFDLLPENNPTIKKYIHGTTLEQQLNQISASGTTTQVTYNYPSEIEKVIQNKKPGLKLQYTYNATLDPKVKSNFRVIDPATSWVDVTNNSLPTTTIPVGTKAIYVRILVTDENTYVYGPDEDNNKTKGKIDLTNLKDQINVESSWLNKKFPENGIIKFEEITLDKITQFEQNVFDGITSLTQEQKEKLEIKYYFNGAAAPINKSELLTKLTSYQNADKFNFLQLWNGSQGEKIEATFAKKNESGNYDLIWQTGDTKKQVLETSGVITTINLIPLVEWLEQVKVNVTKNGNTITSLQFPPISAAGTVFDKKDWTKAEQVLESLAIRVQYQEMTATTNSNNWSDDISGIQNYDNRARFKIRFVLQQQKGKNLIVKVRNNEADLSGSQSIDRISGDIIVNLNVPKVIRIDNAVVQTFKNSNPFSGDTKRINVQDSSLSALLDGIKNSNLNNQIPSIENVPLDVEFRFGASGNFKSLEQWKEDSEAMTTDQETNSIQIKFTISSQNSNEWALEDPNGFYTVLNANNSTVPIYVHDQGIENSIKAKTTITGDNTNLQINFATSSDGFTVNDNNAITGSKGNGLKIQFSLNPSLGVDADGWLDQRPTSAPAGTDKLFMRIVPVDNWHVYEKKVEGQYEKIEISFQIAQKLTVDKQWINDVKLGGNSIEIASLTADKINEWINQIRQKVKTANNNISDEIAQKVSIKFTYKGQGDLDANGLYQAIKADRENYNSNNLGIVQLWNGNKGDKINAKFVAADNTVIIQDKNGSNTDLNADINLAHVFTQINLKAYVNALETQFTTVENNGTQGQINSFTPPSLSTAGVQFANKTFDDINTRLNQVGVTINFKQGNNQWVPKESVNSYDVATALLPLAFTNESNNNIKLELKDGLIIEQNSNNQTNPINLKLQVPKRFNINTAPITEFRNSNPFSGDTKNLIIEQAKVDKLLKDLKTSAGAPADVNLVASFRLSNEDNNTYRNVEDFKSYLLQQTADKTSNGIVMKLDIDSSQQDQWFIQEDQKQPYTVAPDNNPNIKLFINDLGIFEKLKTTRLDGNNNNLIVTWPEGFSVSSNGTLTITPTKGVGLKLEFTFNPNLNPAEAGNTGSDPQTHWVSSVPNSFDLTNQNLYIRIQVTDPKYIYEKAPTQPTDKITLSLTNLFQSIQVDGAWLNKPFKTNGTVDLANLQESDFNEYENSVKAGMSLDPGSKAKVAIVYSFNGIANLNKTQLVQEIKKYENSTTDQSKNLGLLKLWNGSAGTKITSTFTKADDGGNYELTWKNPSNKNFDLDLSKILSAFDITKIVQWLETIRVEITQGSQANSISSINFKPISAPGSPFNNKTWTEFETILKALDIKIEYQAVYKGSSGSSWNENISSITQYDPSNPTFKVRFSLPVNKNKNVKLLVKASETVSGSGIEDRDSNPITVNLAVPKKIELDENTINTSFISQPDVIKGNTKNLVISKEKETSMIKALLNWNQQQNSSATPPFSDARLTVLYSIGQNPQTSNQWEDLDTFTQTLANATDDKGSNQINFKFKINPDQSDLFTIDENQIFTLHNHEAPSNNTKIKYFVNKASWEASAAKISVGGTNNNLNWNFSAFGNNNIQETSDGQVILRTVSGNALMLQFTTNANAKFNDGDDKVSSKNDASEIGTKWVKFKPTSLSPNTKIVKVRIVENPGYYYEPAHTTTQADQGSVHDINVNVQIELTVNKQWFNEESLGGSSIEIASLTVEKINEWEEKIYKKIQTNNQNIESSVAKKILIKYSYKANSNLTAAELIAKIQADLNNFAGPDLGIVQLAKDGNNSLGEIISATFTTSSQDIIIKDANGTANDLSGQVNTNNIFTKIDLSTYVDNLKKSKTQIRKKPNGSAGEIEGFTLPELNGSGQFANKAYELIAAALKKVGIEIEFAKEPGGPWSPKEAIKSYNVQTAVLYLAFSNKQNNNIELVIDNNRTSIGAGNNNKDNPIKLPLNVPKQINIDPAKDQFNQLQSQLKFSGNTKNIEFNLQAVTEVIKRILQRNSTEANGDGSFNSAPLKMLFKVGGLDFVESDQLKQHLAGQSDDLTDRSIKIKFAISGSNNNEWELSNPNFEYQLYDDSNSPLKIYVNDKGIFEDLKKTTFTGTNEALVWNFQSGIDVDKTNGQLRKTISGKTYGVGLKLSYSFDQQTWINKQPTSYEATKKQVFIKVDLEEEKYFYEKSNEVITLDLNLPVNINLKHEWLNQPLITVASKSVDEFIKEATTILNEYEKKVYEAAKNGGIDTELHSKFTIKYSFDGNGNLTKEQLVQKLTNYKNEKINNNNFGILQLWNGATGIKIESNFADSNESDNFIIKPDDATPFVLDTNKVITTIDFSKVVAWLTDATRKIEIEEDNNTPNSIKKIKIPNTGDLSDDYFNNRDWSNIENALASFGIEIEYKADGINNATWGPLSSVKTYNPANGQILFRFKFKNNQYTNVKLKINSEQLDGNNPTATSSEYKFKLDVKLTIFVDQNKIDTFIKTAGIKGDTKRIQINPEAEKQLIENIKQENAAINPEFSAVNLKVQYYLGNETDSGIQWKEWNQFKTDLNNQTSDQRSNRVIFRLTIDESQNGKFSVSDAPHVLHDNKVSPEKWTVKYFVNKANLENNAGNIKVKGTSSDVIWNYDVFGKTNIDKEPQQGGNKIFIKNSFGQRMLQVLFSTKPTITYNDPQSDTLNDITTKWTTIEPIKFLDEWNVSKLYVKLIPVVGYVYEAQEDQSAEKHEISLANLKLEIKVNPENLKAPLNLSADKKYLHELALDNINQFVQKAIQTVQINSDKVDVQFKFKSKVLNSNQLLTEIKNLLGDISNGSSKNIVQLWNGASGEKIEAQFILKDSAKNQYTLIDSINSQENAERFVPVNTSNIKTLINLKEIISSLEQLKINVILPSQTTYDLSPLERLEMPKIPDGNTSELQGLPWDKFEEKLKTFGVLIEARPKVKTGIPDQNWTSIKDIKKYDDNLLSLELRFKINPSKGQNIVLSVKKDGDVESTTTEDKLPIFEMSLKAPAKVVVSENLISTFKSKVSFTGDTKNLEINSVPEQELIEAIIKENIANNPNIFNELRDRLEVQYYLGKNNPNNNSSITWRTAADLKAFLATQDRDQTTNQIWFRLNVKNPTDANGQIFQVDPKAEILSPEEINATAKIKIYVNETGFSAEINKLKAVGSTDSFTISGLENWLKTIPTGLEVWYSNRTNPNEDDDSEWTTTRPTTLTSDKKLWIRFKVKDGYVYQNAKTDNDRYSDKHPINTEGIKVIIKLETKWLNQIIFTGNTRNPNINEDKVLEAIRAASVLPTDQPDLIELQYNIKGTNDWLTKDAFTTKLNQLAGTKDSNNFILRREELQVRFNIKNSKKNDDYGLNINGEDIDSTNRDKFNVQVVDQNRNNDFKGYINLDQLKDFTAESFKIIGSTSKPKLIISKRDSLNTSFMPYISEGLFDIQFSTVKNADGTWNWDSNHTLLKDGKLIDENGLISQNIQIGAEKHFAIRFISKDPNYDVYKGDQIQSDGYLLDLTSNVTITVEITNPFTAANKKLGIWTRDNKQAKYQQGKGGFKIVVAEPDWTINSNQIQSAQAFLKTSTNLTGVEKEALEFVYHIFPNQPSSSDVDELKAKITNYQDSSWKTFNPESDDWSGSLGLKVGDYVSVALRVKESYTNKTDGAFILKDDDYAMLIPITNDKEPGRVAGYQVDVDAISIQENNIGLFNNEDSTLPPIDGYTSLAKISLDKDEQGQYLGVDLDLQVYSEFYLNQNDGILVAPVSKQRLIKRESGSGITNKGNYKDANGQDLTDKNGDKIPILKDANNRLAKPIKGQARSQALDNLGSGEFKLPSSLTTDQNEKLSFFRNQDIDVKLKGRVGQGTTELPDYYANKERTIELKNLISPRIKFTVDNDKNVKYEWPQEEFNPDQIQYQNSDNTPGDAKDGKAQVATVLKIKRWENNVESVITGTDFNDALKQISDMLTKDFGGQLRFETIYQQATGNTTTFKDNNIYQLRNLKNRDRITVRIVATDDDLYYTGEPNPLVINVNGLVESAPKQEQLQYLRVEQSGQVEGKGSFRVLATDPNIPGQTNEQVLAGWKFMLRVWDKNKAVKIEWTDDQTRINNLENGDKIEWKLVSADGNPVDKPYYNTVALNHEYDENNHVKYNFAKVNYPKGESSKRVVESNIGQYPTTDQYPEDSGYVIAGLKPIAELFKISSGSLTKIFKVLTPTYVGLNHQGTINFDNQYLNNHYYVNTDGEIYQKLPGENNLLTDDSNNTNELFEIPVEELLENITFYNQDPILNPYQNGFKFSDNTVNINNHLSNGDQIWAQFSFVKDDNNGLNSGVTVKLNPVSGLKSTADPMSPFWYVLMALAGIATLGVSGIVAFVVARHKKLKGKN